MGSFLHLVLDHLPPLTFQNLVWVEDMIFHHFYIDVNLLNSCLIERLKEVKWKPGESQLLLPVVQLLALM